MSRATDPLDTFLLRVLETLIAERSVSKAAARLNQSQPAISAVLKRLRETFNDPLLVREKGQMIPTARALELVVSARVILEEAARMMAEPTTYVAATSQREFRVGAADFLTATFLGEVVELMREEAPLTRLAVIPLRGDLDYETALANGELDLVIGNWPNPPPQLHLSILLEDDIVCLMGKHNPLSENMTQANYLAAAHIVPLQYSNMHRGVVETQLSSMRLARNAVITLPFFSIAPYLLVRSDLVFTTSRHFANYYADFLPLKIVTPPIAFPVMRFYQLWHERTHRSSAHEWLRSVFTKASRRTREANRKGAQKAKA
ncbi:MAG TPA: LysR family transcriptional regulator [Noviherbaspirillum sp.]|nr:LysR family transcriptional regulator [Noviherbaspirillum sp.]